jgi:putative tricarboxylic transport membrane protein
VGAALVASNAPCAPSTLIENAQCIAPAKPGGGFDITCQLVRSLLQESGMLLGSMQISYVPGGIGAVAYNVVIAQRPAEPNTLVAFSTGSLLNLAQGKFGRYTAEDVRWLAAIGADHGAIAVAEGSAIHSLQDLQALLRRDASKVLFGGGGAVGSQDWMKAALIARAMGVNYKSLRYVAFEGGGEALTALRGGHIHVFVGDAAETVRLMASGLPVRIVAALSHDRIPGKMRSIPTAREQGFDVEWQIVRGVYLGPKVPDADYARWSEAFRKIAGTARYRAMLEERGMDPYLLLGPELERYVHSEVEKYRQLAREFGLRVAPPPE